MRWVALAVVVVFGLSVGGGFVWDDGPLIENNELLREPGAWTRAFTADFWDTSVATRSTRSYWRPIPKLSHYVLRAMGPSAWQFHLANVLLHLAASLLTFVWLKRRLFDSGVDAAMASQGALAGALLFALHPSRFEAVGWVSSSTELFFGCFVLSGLLLLDAGRKWWPLAFAAFALAMMSKETALMLPVLVAGDAWFRHQLRPRLGAIAVVAVGVLVPFGLRAMLGVGLPNVLDLATPFEKVARVAGAFLAYHGRTVAPTEVTFYATDIAMRWPGTYGVPSAWVPLGLALMVGWLAFGVFAWRRSIARPYLADAVWWLVPLLPVLLIVATPNPFFVSDRFLYLPMLGVASVVARLAATPSRHQRLFRLALGGALLASATLIVLALPAYRDNRTFTARELTLHPDNEFAFEEYSSLLRRTGFLRAQAHLLEAKLAGPATDTLRCRRTLQLARARAAVVPDSETEALGQLLAFFEGVRDGRAVPLGAFRMTDDAEVLASFREDPMLPADVRALEVRLGKLDAATQDAQADWQTGHGVAAARELARLRVFAGKWAEAAAVLDEARTRVPALGEERFFQQVQAGAALATRTDVEAALKRTALLLELDCSRCARRELAPLTQGDDVLEARVQVELHDRRFASAQTLLEGATTPRLLALREAVAREASTFEQEREAELTLADPTQVY